MDSILGAGAIIILKPLMVSVTLRTGVCFGEDVGKKMFGGGWMHIFSLAKRREERAQNILARQQVLNTRKRSSIICTKRQ
jgi:hypothetical protein